MLFRSQETLHRPRLALGVGDGEFPAPARLLAGLGGDTAARSRGRTLTFRVSTRAGSGQYALIALALVVSIDSLLLASRLLTSTMELTIGESKKESHG